MSTLRALKLFNRAGSITQQPPFWAAVAGALALWGGARGRRAAARGSLCYGLTGVLANLVIKPVVRRPRPLGAGTGGPGPITSSFPSGHAATDLAFSLGVAQELPLLFVPLALATAAGHWSLVRTRGHHPTDVLAGGVLGAAVAAGVWLRWRPGRSPDGPETGPDTGVGAPPPMPASGPPSSPSAGAPEPAPAGGAPAPPAGPNSLGGEAD